MTFLAASWLSFLSSALTVLRHAGVSAFSGFIATLAIGGGLRGTFGRLAVTATLRLGSLLPVFHRVAAALTGFRLALLLVGVALALTRAVA